MEFHLFKKPVPRIAFFVAGWVVACGAAGLALEGGGQATAETIATSVLTGIIEETVFCGMLLPFLKKYLNGRVFLPLLICSAIFALCHVPAGAALGFGVFGVILKVVQAFLFGLVMYCLATMTGGLAFPIVTHAVFDVFYISFAAQTFVALAAVTALLAPAVIVVIWFAPKNERSTR